MDYERDRVIRLIAKNTNILVGLFIVTIIAGILQAAGYATPGWLVFTGTSDANITFSASIGLWYQRFCTEECEIGYISSAVIWSKEDRKTFDTYKLIATVAVVFSIFCPIVILVYIRRVRLQRDITSQAFASMLATIGSGVLALVVVGKIASDAHKAYDNWIKTEKDTDFKLGLLYSELLMGLGGALNCLAFIVLCVQILFRKKDTGGSGGEESVGMTSDSK